jgi:hypothetical protein
MSKASAVTIYREVCVDLWRELHKLRGDHEALMQVMIEEMPVAERARVLQKYDLRRQRIYEDDPLNLEAKFLKLAEGRNLQNNLPLAPGTRSPSHATKTSRPTKANQKPKRQFLSFVARPKGH